VRVLVIDDEPDLLELVRIILEGAGYEVKTCNSGRNAWDAIIEAQPNLVILDVMLPGLDGYSLQMQMSQEKATKNIPVIILTALEPAKTLFEKSTNVVGFLSKPFRSEELLARVKSALATRA